VEGRSTQKVVKPGDPTSGIGVLASMLFLSVDNVKGPALILKPYYAVDMEVCYEF
jgi:hypothetical protein